jgi:LysM repeat protein
MVTSRPEWLPSAGRLARIAAPAVFLIAVTGIVLLVRSSLRSAEPAQPTVPARVQTTRQRPVRPAPAPVGRFYVISPGDTLGSIAARFATTVDDLTQLNPGIEPTSLRPGEQIRIG